MKRVVMISGVRTPVGRYMGALKEVPAYDLGALVLNEAVKRAGLDPVQVDEVILGQSYQSGEYVNIARMSLLKAGWPDPIPGISLGHPIACTGTRVLVTLLHEMKRRNSRYGLECICGGGGLGIAAIFERI